MITRTGQEEGDAYARRARTLSIVACSGSCVLSHVSGLSRASSLHCSSFSVLYPFASSLRFQCPHEKVMNVVMRFSARSSTIETTVAVSSTQLICQRPERTRW